MIHANSSFKRSRTTDWSREKLFTIPSLLPPTNKILPLVNNRKVIKPYNFWDNIHLDVWVYFKYMCPKEQQSGHLVMDFIRALLLQSRFKNDMKHHNIIKFSIIKIIMITLIIFIITITIIIIITTITISILMITSINIFTITKFLTFILIIFITTISIIMIIPITKSVTQ